MTKKISKFFLLILLFVLQSCSGGKIGNFLESSFENINQENIIPKTDDVDINPNDNKSFTNTEISVNTKQIISKKVDERNQDNEVKDSKNKKQIIKNKEDKNNKTNKIKSENKINLESKFNKKNNKYNPQSYRITVILNKVDPSFPTENFSKVLRDSNINFEIEKVERLIESNQNSKSIQSNLRQ